MISGKIKNYFPGGNTSEGFYSFYNYLPYEAERIFIFKGGPGTGKSTFMKKTGKELVERGYDIEYHWCSSDNDSLDGLVIPELKVALMDGTAPHTVDPKFPGVVDEIINLGCYWNRAKLEKSKQKIIDLTQSISRRFNGLYSYLQEARLVHDRWEEYYLEGMNFQKANHKTDKITKELLGYKKLADNVGAERHLFGSAFTPKGVVDYFNNITADLKSRYIIKGRPGTGKSTLMKQVAQDVLQKGYNVQYFHCSFDPASIDMIVIPKLDTALIDGTAPHVVDAARIGDLVIDMFECVAQDIYQKNLDKIKEVEDSYSHIMEKALQELQIAKRLHDELEEYYIEAMDFTAVEARREETMYEIVES